MPLRSQIPKKISQNVIPRSRYPPNPCLYFRNNINGNTTPPSNSSESVISIRVEDNDDDNLFIKVAGNKNQFTYNQPPDTINYSTIEANGYCICADNNRRVCDKQCLTERCSNKNRGTGEFSKHRKTPNQSQRSKIGENFVTEPSKHSAGGSSYSNKSLIGKQEIASRVKRAQEQLESGPPLKSRSKNIYLEDEFLNFPNDSNIIIKRKKSFNTESIPVDYQRENNNIRFEPEEFENQNISYSQYLVPLTESTPYTKSDPYTESIPYNMDHGRKRSQSETRKPSDYLLYRTSRAPSYCRRNCKGVRSRDIDDAYTAEEVNARTTQSGNLEASPTRRDNISGDESIDMIHMVAKSPDIYRTVFGPTNDETILYGIQSVYNVFGVSKVCAENSTDEVRNKCPEKERKQQEQQQNKDKARHQYKEQDLYQETNKDEDKNSGDGLDQNWPNDLTEVDSISRPNDSAEPAVVQKDKSRHVKWTKCEVCSCLITNKKATHFSTDKKRNNISSKKRCCDSSSPVTDSFISDCTSMKISPRHTSSRERSTEFWNIPRKLKKKMKSLGNIDLDKIKGNVCTSTYYPIESYQICTCCSDECVNNKFEGTPCIYENNNLHLKSKSKLAKNKSDHSKHNNLKNDICYCNNFNTYPWILGPSYKEYYKTKGVQYYDQNVFKEEKPQPGPLTNMQRKFSSKMCICKSYPLKLIKKHPDGPSRDKFNKSKSSYCICEEFPSKVKPVKKYSDDPREIFKKSESTQCNCSEPSHRLKYARKFSDTSCENFHKEHIVCKGSCHNLRPVKKMIPDHENVKQHKSDKRNDTCTCKNCVRKSKNRLLDRNLFSNHKSEPCVCENIQTKPKPRERCPGHIREKYVKTECPHCQSPVKSNINKPNSDICEKVKHNKHVCFCKTTDSVPCGTTSLTTDDSRSCSSNSCMCDIYSWFQYGSNESVCSDSCDPNENIPTSQKASCNLCTCCSTGSLTCSCSQTHCSLSSVGTSSETDSTCSLISSCKTPWETSEILESQFKKSNTKEIESARKATTPVIEVSKSSKEDITSETKESRNVCCERQVKISDKKATFEKSFDRNKNIPVYSDKTEMSKDYKDKNSQPSSIRYAIARIFQYNDFTAYEILKSTRCKPKYIPKYTEGIFVLKNKTT